jgi:hypothetical protein
MSAGTLDAGEDGSALEDGSTGLIYFEHVKEPFMKKTIALLCALAPLVSGCASSGPPVASAQMTEVEASIRSAENAGAAGSAADLLDRAQKALAAARQASTRGDNDESRRLLEEAKAYAAAAEARSNAERLKKQAAELRQQADELESKAKQLQERTRP